LRVERGGNPTFTVEPNGDLVVGRNKFTVEAAGGATTAKGDMVVGDDKVRITAATGNVTTAGDLDVKGSTTLATTLAVGGDVTLNSLTAAKEVRAGQFIAVSDVRLKQDIQSLGGDQALSVVLALRPCSYAMRSDPDALHAGLLAQEVRDVLPDSVVPTQGGYLGVNYHDIVAYLVGAVAELASRAEELASREPI
jgi:hypothetical protein